MKKPTVRAELANGTWSISLIGQITEDFVFPVPPAGLRSAIIDLGQITYINSTGVRSWLTWSKSLAEFGNGGAPSVDVTLKRAPLGFLRLMEMIQEMIPTGFALTSYFRSHSCLECGKIHHLELPNTAPTASQGTSHGHPLPVCTECGSETELEMPSSFYESLSRFAAKRSA